MHILPPYYPILTYVGFPRKLSSHLIRHKVEAFSQTGISLSIWNGKGYSLLILVT
jgi:hypothetical protein